MSCHVDTSSPWANVAGMDAWCQLNAASCPAPICTRVVHAAPPSATSAPSSDSACAWVDSGRPSDAAADSVWLAECTRRGSDRVYKYLGCAAFNAMAACVAQSDTHCPGCSISEAARKLIETPDDVPMDALVDCGFNPNHCGRRGESTPMMEDFACMYTNHAQGNTQHSCEQPPAGTSQSMCAWDSSVSQCMGAASGWPDPPPVKKPFRHLHEVPDDACMHFIDLHSSIKGSLTCQGQTTPVVAQASGVLYGQQWPPRRDHVGDVHAARLYSPEGSAAHAFPTDGNDMSTSWDCVRNRLTKNDVERLSTLVPNSGAVVGSGEPCYYDMYYVEPRATSEWSCKRIAPEANTP